jgi:hypothetical protein
MLVRSLAVWFGLVMIAMANGTLREFVITPRWGTAVGHLVSSLLLATLIVVVAWLTIGWIAPATPIAGLRIGAWWLLWTVLFEFGFGRLRGRSWSVLLADYDLSRGRIWVLVLLATLLGPWLAGRWRGIWPGSGG